MLCVQRTGWGKSAVYFVATALLREQGSGPTLLVSPLLALMRNQVLAAERARPARAHDQLVEPRRVGADRGRARARRGRPADDLARAAEQPGVPRATCCRTSSTASACWWSTRRTASATGATTSGPTTGASPRCCRRWPATSRVLCTTATANDRVVADVEAQLQTEAGALLTLRGHARARVAAARGRRPARQRRAPGLAGHARARTCRAAGSSTASRSGTSRSSPTGCASRASPPSPTAATATPSRAPASSSGCWPTRSSASWRPARWAWATTSPTWASSSTTSRPDRRSPTTSRSAAPGASSTRPHAVLLRGIEDRQIQDYFINVAFPPEQRVREVLDMLESRGRAAVAARDRAAGQRPPRPARGDAQGARGRGRGRRATGAKWSRTERAVGVRRRARRARHRRPPRRAEGDGGLRARRGLPDAVPARRARRPGRRALRALRRLHRAAVRRPGPPELVREAVAFVRGRPVRFEPRKRWIGARKGNVEERRAARGGPRAVVRERPGLGAAGWSPSARQGAFDDELVEAARALIADWPTGAALGDGGPVAARPGAACTTSPSAWPPRSSCRSSRWSATRREAPPQAEMENSAQQADNVDGVVRGRARRGAAARARCCWSTTCAPRAGRSPRSARVLRAGGAGPVYPFVLAVS